METIIVTHAGRTVALAAPHRVWLARHVEDLPDGAPLKRFVAAMAIYAGEILNGRAAGPYTDDDAERFARLALINPHLIDAHPDATVPELAKLARVPADQIAKWLADDAERLGLATHAAAWPPPVPCQSRRRRRAPADAR